MDTLEQLIARADAEFTAHGYGPVDAEQLDCLQNPERADEALDMVDHWVCRLGLSDDLFYELNEWIEDNRGVDDARRSNGPRA